MLSFGEKKNAQSFNVTVFALDRTSRQKRHEMLHFVKVRVKGS